MEKESDNEINSGLLCDRVGDLPIGRGKGVLSLKNGRNIEITMGRVVRKKNVQGFVVVLENFKKNDGKIVGRETFAARTQFLSWEPAEECLFCALPCNGICHETDLY